MTINGKRLIFSLTAFTIMATFLPSPATAAELDRAPDYRIPTVETGGDGASAGWQEDINHGSGSEQLLHRQKNGRWSLSSFTDSLEALDFEQDVYGLKLKIHL